MTCLRTNTAMFCSTAAPSIPAPFLLNPFLPSLTLTHCNRELTPSTALSQCSASTEPALSQTNTLSPRLIWLLKVETALVRTRCRRGYVGQRKTEHRKPLHHST
ncbi:hypothetical protein CesoFtcFv8_000582 [Champsocephalus esox]|uniref:Uncharacterized protein n=1 Tax=Champsocephalus esox TaxID=159716 RepID=A0AAN8D6N1_9TELE|nr:hypothetical protein CesoFtcFv8_000582 [Champsocephalus esox]